LKKLIVSVIVIRQQKRGEKFWGCMAFLRISAKERGVQNLIHQPKKGLSPERKAFFTKE